VQEEANRYPNRQGNPFGAREVAWKDGNKLHQEKQQRDTDAQAGDDAHAGARVDEPKGEAGGEPAEGGSHGADFGDGDEDGIAEEEANEGANRNADDSDRRRGKYGVDGGEARSDSAAAGVGEEQPGGGGEVSVETLEETEESHDEDELNGPVLAEGILEGEGGGETSAKEGLPGGDVADGEDAESLEKGADSEGEADGVHVAGLAEIGVGFLGVFGDRFETGHEIRNDLQGEEDGEKRSGVENGMEICGSAADGADADKGDENEEDHARHGLLEIGAEADATVVDSGEEQSKRNTQNQTRQEDRLATYAIQLVGIERGKNVGGDFSEGHGFPWADYEVGEEHHPPGEIADDGRKNLRGVGGFAGGVGKALYPLAVNVADRKKNDSADGETESGTGRTAAAEPVVHKDEPAGADHGAEGESKQVV